MLGVKSNNFFIEDRSQLIYERNKPVSSCNVQADRTGDVQPGAKQTGVGGAVVVPIRGRGGNAIGALGIGVHRQHEYSDAEVARLLEEAVRLEHFLAHSNGRIPMGLTMGESLEE
jgi:hypothetical protein